MALGPLLWSRPAPADAGSREAVPDYAIRARNQNDDVSGKYNAPLHRESWPSTLRDYRSQTHPGRGEGTE